MLVRGFQRVKQLTIAEEMSAADEASACTRLPDDNPNDVEGVSYTEVKSICLDVDGALPAGSTE